ncbi:MAG: hypothetical protein LBS55_12465 [Prevotellaceae bacterium]|jgi:hypothetical protein|nr:hypothetical protein [Prevotellaceae bacterium]
MFVLSGILILIFGFLFLVQPEITTGNFFYDKNSYDILVGKERILWDTGSEGTFFFQDFAFRKICCVMPSITYDYGGGWSITPFYFSRIVELVPFTIKNVFYSIEAKENISPFMKKFGFGGILGMNIISQANWVVDFSENSIKTLSKDDDLMFNCEPKLLLLYNKRSTPKTTFIVQEIKIKDILIDSGSDADIVLCESDIKKINQIIHPIDTNNYRTHGLYSSSTKGKQYVYKSIAINNHQFDTLKIRQGNTRLIGMGFFRKFDKVYLNTEEKIFRFY